METIGKKIRKLRAEKDISQEELAYDLGVARQTISNWEVDSKIPSTDNIIALTEYFGVGSDYFLSSSNYTRESKAEESETAAAESVQSGGNKLVINKTLFVILLVLLISVFIINIIIGSIMFYLLTIPKRGVVFANSIEFEWIGIVCVCIGILALIGIITLSILWAKNKRKRPQPPVGELQTEDGRQKKDSNL